MCQRRRDVCNLSAPNLAAAAGIKIGMLKTTGGAPVFGKIRVRFEDDSPAAVSK
jgi:hypothetical protein